MRKKIDCAETECCDCIEIHGECIKKVIERMPAEVTLIDLAALFKVFGDPTRVKHMTQSAISHQLRILKQMKLVKSRREGKTVFYSLADDHIQTILNQGMEHVME